MKLNPLIYTKLIRPKLSIKLYTEKIIKERFNFENKRILDFGCGTGSNCYIFDSNKYLGVDPDPERILYAKKIFPQYKFDIIKKTVPVRDHFFDFICIFSTIHHISDKDFKIYLREFLRVLKQNGTLIVIEPCLFENSFFNNRFMNIFDEGNYIRTEKSYIDLFENMFNVSVHKRLRKFFFYNELFFSAKPVR